MIGFLLSDVLLMDLSLWKNSGLEKRNYKVFLESNGENLMVTDRSKGRFEVFLRKSN